MTPKVLNKKGNNLAVILNVGTLAIVESNLISIFGNKKRTIIIQDLLKSNRKFWIRFSQLFELDAMLWEHFKNKLAV